VKFHLIFSYSVAKASAGLKTKISCLALTPQKANVLENTERELFFVYLSIFNLHACKNLTLLPQYLLTGCASQI